MEINEGRGEVSLQLPQSKGAYSIYFEPIDFTIKKSEETIYDVSIEIENGPENEIEIFCGGPVVSMNPYIRETKTKVIAKNSKILISFADIPKWRGAEKNEYLKISGADHPINVNLHVLFTKPVNGSMKTTHEASTL